MAKEWTLSSLHKEGYGRFSRAPADPNLCCMEVSSGGNWQHYRQCTRKRGHGREQAYCKQHDPEAVKARREVRNAKWRAQSDERDRRWKLEAAAPRMLDALRQIRDGHNDPRALAEEALRGLED